MFRYRHFEPPFVVGSTLPNSPKRVNQTAECGLKREKLPPMLSTDGNVAEANRSTPEVSA